MAATKAVQVDSNNVTLTAGAANTTSSGVNISDTYSADAVIKLTNGATGPTIAAQVQPQISMDNSNWYDLGGPLVGGTANNGVYSWTVQIPQSALYFRTVSGSNTAQNVTLRVEVGETSALS